MKVCVLRDNPRAGADPGFSVRGGALKFFLGVFRVKNHDFKQKNHFFFSILGGARAGCAPPLNPPLPCPFLFLCSCNCTVNGKKVTGKKVTG